MKPQSQSLPKVSPTVFVVSPGMPFDPIELKKSLAIVKSWGLRVYQPKDLLKKNHPICSSDRDTRAQHLSQALTSNDVDIIWAVRGGYGSLHLIPFLQKLKKPKKKKLFIGFSDNTTLHQFLNQEWGWPTWHGPHLDRLYKLNSARQKQWQDLLQGRLPYFKFKGLTPLNLKAQKTSLLRCEIVGGNLITLQSSLGTAMQLKTKGRILFVEDIGERGYRIDRVLEHFSQAGVFDGIKALVVGPFVGGAEPNGKDLSQKVFKEFAARQKFPIFSGVKSGHVPNSLILPLKTSSVLQKESSASAKWSLTVETGWSL